MKPPKLLNSKIIKKKKQFALVTAMNIFVLSLFLSRQSILQRYLPVSHFRHIFSFGTKILFDIKQNNLLATGIH